MRADLIEEMFAAGARVGEPQLRRMQDLGVSREALARLAAVQPPFGLQSIRETNDGLYEPIEEGSLAIVVPVMEYSVTNNFGVQTDIAEIVDIVAFQSVDPLKWLWRTGSGWALGADLLLGDEPLELVRHPLDWLSRGGEAFCLLDWGATPRVWLELRQGAPLYTTDEPLRAQLNAACRAATPPVALKPDQWVYRHGRYVRAA